ncbi:hypothetical protein AB0N28_29110, partial [Streptomyces sp. NPDC051130]
MAPQPQGAPRWDARTQRWVWDAPAGAPADTPAPGHAWVLTLFGRYRGTVRRTGLTWVSPLLLRRRV